ncbi:MAG: hypothetical protein ASARMPREDX12_008145 [Alectoria sarmentosa]|nr:MAG: hypothetical protein ASARMPREDX12_008145 [Alectoria sarmentosa]
MSQVFVSFSLPILSSVPSVLLLVISIVATLAVVLRLWARKIQKVRLELNDYMIMLGLVFALADVIIYISIGALLLSVETSTENLFIRLITELNFIIPLLWITAVTLIRFSVILLYIRIFATRSFRLSCYVILILNITFFIATFLSYVLSAIPVGCHWSDTIDCSSTLDAKSIDLPVAVFNLLLDVTVVVLPMPVLWGLQMAVGKKATLSGMFGLGFTICAITAYRVQITATIGSLDSGGHIEINTVLFMFEAILGVITACLPVLKPVFDKVRDSMKRYDDKKGISKFLKSGSISIFMRMSQIWKWKSGKRAERERLDSMISMEDLGRSESGIQSTPKVERVVGMKVFEINVQREVNVESTSIEE